MCEISNFLTLEMLNRFLWGFLGCENKYKCQCARIILSKMSQCLISTKECIVVVIVLFVSFIPLPTTAATKYKSLLGFLKNFFTQKTKRRRRRGNGMLRQQNYQYGVTPKIMMETGTAGGSSMTNCLFFFYSDKKITK